MKKHFCCIIANEKLVYTWSSDARPSSKERVSVHFNAITEGCEVVLIHEQIATQELVDHHIEGWMGCLDGLKRLF